jgi:hypothetical protein
MYLHIICYALLWSWTSIFAWFPVGLSWIWCLIVLGSYRVVYSIYFEIRFRYSFHSYYDCVRLLLLICPVQFSICYNNNNISITWFHFINSFTDFINSNFATFCLDCHACSKYWLLTSFYLLKSTEYSVMSSLLLTYVIATHGGYWNTSHM